MAELEWQAGAQAVMLRTAERYFELALAQEQWRVLELQAGAVQQASAEVQERFRMGANPITDTHEAGARLAAVQAQMLAAEADLQLELQLLADSSGLLPGRWWPTCPPVPPLPSPRGRSNRGWPTRRPPTPASG